MRYVYIISLLLFTFFSAISHAVVEQVEFADQQTADRYKDLIAELRCLVCQNQNLADSDADLAKDLRRKTAEMLRAGKSDQDILDYMRDRYGDFVLYRPPFNSMTAILWLGPFILLLMVVIGIVIYIRHRQQHELLKPTHANDEEQRTKVRNLLRDAPQLDPKRPNETTK